MLCRCFSDAFFPIFFVSHYEMRVHKRDLSKPSLLRSYVVVGVVVEIVVEVLLESKYHSMPWTLPSPVPSVISLKSKSVQSMLYPAQPIHLSMTTALTVVPLVGLTSVTLMPQ